MSDHVNSLIRACQRDAEGGPGLTPNELGAIMDQLKILSNNAALMQHVKERIAKRIAAHPDQPMAERYGVWTVRQLTALGRCKAGIEDVLKMHPSREHILNEKNDDGR